MTPRHPEEPADVAHWRSERVGIFTSQRAGKSIDIEDRQSNRRIVEAADRVFRGGIETEELIEPADIEHSADHRLYAGQPNFAAQADHTSAERKKHSNHHGGDRLGR